MLERLGQVVVGLVLLFSQLLREQPERPALGPRRVARQARQQIELHIAVASLAEHGGERLDLGERPPAALALQTRTEDLERSAQAACCDAHRVDALDLIEIEHLAGWA